MTREELHARVRELVDAAPPLTESRRDRVQALLRTTPGRVPGEHDPRAGCPRRTSTSAGPGARVAASGPGARGTTVNRRTRAAQQEPTEAPA